MQDAPTPNINPSIKLRSAQINPLSHSYRPDIDGLRAIAVLSVVAFHAFPKWCRGGFVGVDIFFVISGFLISRIIIEQARSNSFSYADFYSRRVRRIFPALVIMVAAVLVVGAGGLLADEYAKSAQHAIFGLLFTANLDLFAATGYFNGDAKLNPFLHLWSLGVEEQYYIFWPPAVILVIRFFKDPKSLILICGILSFVLNIYMIKDHRDATFYLPFTRFWELLAGAYLAYNAVYHSETEAFVPGATSRHLVRDAVSVASLVLIAISILFIDESKAFPGFWAVIPVAGAYLAILSGPHAIINRLLLSNPIAVFVGLISYPLYIWHWPLLVLDHILSLGYSTGMSRAVAVAAAFLLAWSTYRLIERPLRSSRRSRTVVALLASAAVLAAASAAIRLDNGVPFRPVDVAARQSASPGTALAMQQFYRKFNSFPKCEPGVVPTNTARPDWCLKAQPGPARYVLVGDSHAQALFAGLAEAVPGNWMLVGGNGCPPVRDVKAWYVGTRESCMNQVRTVIATAAQQKGATTVVLTMGAPFYITDIGLAPDHQGSRSPANFRLEGPSGHDQPKAAVLEAGLRRTINTLTSAGKRVELIIDVPEMAWNPQQCVDRKWKLRPKLDCAMPRTLIMARQADYRAIIARIAADTPGLKVFDPLPVLCDATQCPMIRDKQLLYRDSHHLTLAGSALVAGAFATWQKEVDANQTH